MSYGSKLNCAPREKYLQPLLAACCLLRLLRGCWWAGWEPCAKFIPLAQEESQALGDAACCLHWGTTPLAASAAAVYSPDEGQKVIEVLQKLHGAIQLPCSGPLLPLMSSGDAKDLGSGLSMSRDHLLFCSCLCDCPCVLSYLQIALKGLLMCWESLFLFLKKKIKTPTHLKVTYCVHMCQHDPWSYTRT